MTCPKLVGGGTVVYISVNHRSGFPGSFSIVIESEGSLAVETVIDAKAKNSPSLLLEAAIHALKMFGVGEEFTLVCTATYLVNNIRWLDKWQNNGWTKADGKPVKNVPLWIILKAELGKRKVTFAFPKRVKSGNGKEGVDLAGALSKFAQTSGQTYEIVRVEDLIDPNGMAA